MKTFLKILLMVIVALVLGVGSAVVVVKKSVENSWVRNGVWRVNPTIGSPEAGLYAKAIVSLGGLFAMNKKETIYYVAGVDADGQALSSKCDYRIEGQAPAAGWWSITLYGGDYHLVPNPDQRSSYTAQSVHTGPDGRFSISISPNRKSGDWLCSGDQEQIHLLLRLYHPAPEVYENLASVQLPRVIREECR